MLCPEASQKNTIARRRLKKLYDAKMIKRFRDYIGIPYIYYTDKKFKKWEHPLKITDFYVKHHSFIKNWVLEPIIADLRADVLVEMQIHSKRYLIAYEAEIEGCVDIGKYEKLFLTGSWQKILPVFPLVVAGGKYKESKIIKVIGEDELLCLKGL